MSASSVSGRQQLAKPEPLELHKAALIFPEMSDAEYQELRDHIDQHGLQVPIVVWRGKLIDGRHRLRAMTELGIDPFGHTHELPDDADPIAYVVGANVNRRNLSESQRAMIAGKLANIANGEIGRPKGEQICTPSTETKVSTQKAAELMGVSKRSVNTAKAVQRECIEPVQAMVSNGDLSVSAAAKVFKAIPDKAEQSKLAKRGVDAVKQAATKPPVAATKPPVKSKSDLREQVEYYLNRKVESGLKWSEIADLAWANMTHQAKHAKLKKFKSSLRLSIVEGTEPNEVDRSAATGGGDP